MKFSTFALIAMTASLQFFGTVEASNKKRGSSSKSGSSKSGSSKSSSSESSSSESDSSDDNRRSRGSPGGRAIRGSDRLRYEGIEARVFTMTNGFDEFVGNEVIMYFQDSDGNLTSQGRFATGGKGTGAGIFVSADPLASQGSLITNEREDRLFVVNAGDNTLSVFNVEDYGLFLTDTVSTGGPDPLSVTTCGNHVYVLNAGGTASIVGYRINRFGKLTMIPNSTRSLDAIDNGSAPPFFLSAPSQISFTEDCENLIVLNKDVSPPLPAVGPIGPATPGRLMVFGVTPRGIPSQVPVVTELGGLVTFTFNLLEDEDKTILYTTDVILNGSSAFKLNDDKTFSLVQSTVSNGGMDAPCWGANNGEFYFVANTIGNSISSFSIDPEDQTLTLIDATADSREGSEPIDLFYINGFLYQNFAGTGELIVYKQQGGALTEVGSAPGLRAAPEDGPAGEAIFMSKAGGAVGVVAIF